MEGNTKQMNPMRIVRPLSIKANQTFQFRGKFYLKSSFFHIPFIGVTYN